MAFQLTDFVNAPDPFGTPNAFLTSAIDDTTLDILVDSVADLPPASTQFVIKLDTERILITSRTGLMLHADAAGRGWEGSTAAAHADDSPVTHPITRQQFGRFPGPMTDAGDMIYLNEDGAPARLAAPSNGDWAVQWTDGVPSWVAASGGGTPASPDRAIQFKDAGVFGGSADLTWLTTPSSSGGLGVVIGDPADDFQGWGYGQRLNAISYSPTVKNVTVFASVVSPVDDTNGTESFGLTTVLLGTDAYTSGVTSMYNSAYLGNDSGLLTATIPYLQSAWNITQILTGEVTEYAAGVYATAQTKDGGATATVALLAAMYGEVIVDVNGVVANAASYYAKTPTNAGTLPNYYAFWSGDLAGVVPNGYYFWADSQGVLRIREDNVADTASFPQAILALYNPRFTKYTAGATDYERIVIEWINEVAQLRVEKGGSGIVHPLNLVGSAIQHNGNVGVATFGPAPVASITVKDGLVTAIS